MGNTRQPGLPPANTRSAAGGTAKAKAASPEATNLSQRQTLCHKHFCFCAVVLTHVKKIICGDGISASLTLPVIADEYLLLQRVWSSVVFLFPKNQLAFAVGWIIQTPGHSTDPAKVSLLILCVGSINLCLPLANTSA